ncbi:hypothetical protein BJX70DRAFT_359727 [Aspergillus crustosus]
MGCVGHVWILCVSPCARAPGSSPQQDIICDSLFPFFHDFSPSSLGTWLGFSSRFLFTLKPAERWWPKAGNTAILVTSTCVLLRDEMGTICVIYSRYYYDNCLI